eukprot:1919528-Lingulodinium_polyedra.AAC.1
MGAAAAGGEDPSGWARATARPCQEIARPVRVGPTFPWTAAESRAGADGCVGVCPPAVSAVARN